MPHRNRSKSFLNILLFVAIILSLFSVGPRVVKAEEYPDRDKILAGPMIVLPLKGMAYYERSRAMLVMVNNLRTSLGVAPLAYNATLESAALTRAAETSVYWSHMRPDGTFIFDNRPYDGENLAAGNSTTEAIFNQWLNSPSHYAAMVNPAFKSIGIGAYGTIRGEEPRWWAQVFSSSLGEEMPQVGGEAQVVYELVEANASLITLKFVATKDLSPFWEAEEQGKRVKLQVNQSETLIPMVHYKLTDRYATMTSLDPAKFFWNSSDPALVSISDDGILTAGREGQVFVRGIYYSQPQLSAGVDIRVSRPLNLNLSGSIMREEAKALYDRINAGILNSASRGIVPTHTVKTNQLTTGTTANPSGTTAVTARKITGGASPAVTEVGKGVPTLVKGLTWDSELERYALEMIKLNSLYIDADSYPIYPIAPDLETGLDQNERHTWICYSDADRPEDCICEVPEWARSAAAVVLDNGVNRFNFVIFSGSPGNGQTLDQVSPGLMPQGRFDYTISVFADKFNSALVTSGGQNLKISKDKTELMPLLVSDKDWTAAARPALSSLRFISSDESVLKVDANGLIQVQKNGRASVQIKVLDALNQAELAVTTVQIEANLPQYQDAIQRITAPLSGQYGWLAAMGLLIFLILIILIRVSLGKSEKRRNGERR